MKTVVVCCSGENGIWQEAVGAASFLGCPVLRIEDPDPFTGSSDIVLVLSSERLDLDDRVRDILAAADMTGKRVFPVIIHKGLFGRTFRSLKRLLPSCRIAEPHLIVLTDEGRQTPVEDTLRYLTKVRREAGIF